VSVSAGISLLSFYYNNILLCKFIFKKHSPSRIPRAPRHTLSLSLAAPLNSQQSLDTSAEAVKTKLNFISPVNTYKCYMPLGFAHEKEKYRL
jgi:hypothetical protein